MAENSFEINDDYEGWKKFESLPYTHSLLRNTD